MKLESTRIIDIESFVPAASIDRLYWDTPYHLVPSGKTGIEAIAVIREAMEKKGTIAIGRLVMSTRERTCALEPGRDEIVLTTLRTHEEVRDVEEVGDEQRGASGPSLQKRPAAANRNKPMKPRVRPRKRVG